MAAIRWTLGAQRDLQAVAEYIGRHSPTYAVATAARIISAIERLRRQPHLGRIVPEFNEETLRELIVGNYRVVYRCKGKVVGIVAIVHGKRLLKRLRAKWAFD